MLVILQVLLVQSGIIASATDVVEAVTLLNTAVNISDLDGAGDSGTFAVDLDTQSLTIYWYYK